MAADSPAGLLLHVELSAVAYDHTAGFHFVVGFDQVMFDPVRHGTGLDAVLTAALARLRAGAEPDTIGDRSLLPATAAAVAVDRLAREFGE